MTGLVVRELAEDEWAAFGARLTKLEAGVRYPLGTDEFQIDHGADYFGFFRRLGRLRYWIVQDDGRVDGVLALVQREVRGVGAVAYFCDLKAVEGTVGVTRAMVAALRAGALGAGYGISMNPAVGENRVARVVTHLVPTVRSGPILNIYSLSAGQMLRFLPELIAHRGPVSFLSLAGIKEIVLQSTGQPMALRHAQFGPCAEAGQKEPEPGAQHMFCAPAGAALDRAAGTAGLVATASATLLHQQMPATDWSFVLTSDI